MTSHIEPAHYAKLRSRFDSDDQMQCWLETTPIAGFSGLTGQDLIESGRAEQLLEFLEAVDAGIHN